NKDYGNLKEFLQFFDSLKSGKRLSYYFITAYPGSSMKEAEELAQFIKGWKNVSLQIFTPTPMSLATCMYYTALDKDMAKINVPYSYNEKKEQKRVVMKDLAD
ncbi:YgiQ family radical SAM protein, partial [Candidatus Woesearchaeota archaeon CG_4_10_14_0_2_um_filter_33_13]